MKSKNKYVASIIKEYYENKVFLGLLEDNLELIKNNNSNKDNINFKKLTNKINDLRSRINNIELIINNLPADYIKILEYKYCYNKTNTKILSLMNISTTTLWKRLNFIYDKMYKYLEIVDKEK